MTLSKNFEIKQCPLCLGKIHRDVMKKSKSGNIICYPCYEKETYTEESENKCS